MLKLIVLMVLLRVAILGIQLLSSKMYGLFRIRGTASTNIPTALERKNSSLSPAAQAWVSHK